MMYYSDTARMSAIEKIRELSEKVSTIKGSELSYEDACTLNGFLHILENEIFKESKEQKKMKEQVIR